MLSDPAAIRWWDTLTGTEHRMLQQAVHTVEHPTHSSGSEPLASILRRLHSAPRSLASQEAYAQFFTPADVALYTAFTLLEHYDGAPVFDPCMGHGGLLIAAALVLSVRHKLRGTALLDRLGGAEIDAATAHYGFHNLVSALSFLCPGWSVPAIATRLAPHIHVADFQRLSLASLRGVRIIANPPYKETPQGNTWIPLVLRMLQAPLTGLSVILPVSVASARRAQPVRTQVLARFGSIQALHHEIRPRPLFPRIDQRISIKSPRTRLSPALCPTRWPKVAPDDLPFFDACLHHTQRISLSQYRTLHPLAPALPVWIRSTGRYQLVAQTTPPTSLTTKWHRLAVPTALVPLLLTAFASGDVLRWWRIFGDGRDLSLTALQQAYGVPCPNS